MTRQPEKHDDRLPTSQNSSRVLVCVESPSFMQFDHWMDGQLEWLVHRWAHAAAPQALRTGRTSADPKLPR
jgi:hypothetical protein